jgi:hypothetical protein
LISKRRRVMSVMPARVVGGSAAAGPECAHIEVLERLDSLLDTRRNRGRRHVEVDHPVLVEMSMECAITHGVTEVTSRRQRGLTFW